MTSVPYTGNPTPVFLLDDRSWPPDAVLHALAAEINASESTFVLQEAEGTFEVRFFTPTAEEVLCGHGAVGAALTLNLQKNNGNFKFKTSKAGVIDVEVSNASVGRPAQVKMQFGEDPALYAVSEHEKSAFAVALGVDRADLLYVGRNNINDIVVELTETLDFSAAKMVIDPKRLLQASRPGTRSQVITGRASDGADFFKRVFAFGDEGLCI